MNTILAKQQFSHDSCFWLLGRRD